MSDFPVRTSDQLPQLLQAFRKEAGLTQAEAALRMGVSQQTLSALERNPTRVSVDKLMRLLSVLGVELVLHKPHQTHKTHETPPQPGSATSSTPRVW